ncbi:Chain A, Methionine Gamma-Lyase [Tritrichomonas foetus]|uniref:L-methionine gamma-lyase n=1 Tax=Tritrichomonas foetus TaxID=1144522 RepID=A0A1J4JIY1_9EUKA|nr:Chain A, Methionine Gamma-Lyase [Tritrichomonas foetus]|eukprot:OHS99110.1 Chain A, Methionine Gamma-Lyase [Tritrichomonas foetus]
MEAICPNIDWDMDDMTFATKCIHGNPQHDQFGAVIPPIYQTTTFQFKNSDAGEKLFTGKEEGFFYSRMGNPTVANLEGKIAKLEGAEACCATSSGMGAISSTMLSLLKAGDHLIADETLYGCTLELFHEIQKFGIEVTFIDMAIPGEVTKTLKPNTKMIYFETPANPTLKIVDIERVCKEAHAQEGILAVTDNTFCSPVVTNPIQFGVDVVIHSASKYLNGHSDVLAGVVCGKKCIIDQIRCHGLKIFTGSVLSAIDAFLIIRGLMTLELRVKMASQNAQQVAEFLDCHPAVEKIYYPGLKSHTDHEIAKKQMKTYGSMVTFELKKGLEGGKKFLNHLHILHLAVSLGGCESLIQHPASMTHACCTKEERRAAGVTDGMIRFSVGIEGVEDIIADLKQALDMLL